MRKLIWLLAALLIVIGRVAVGESAPLGNQFCVGVTTPTQLASIVDDALARDSKGLTMLDPVRCHRDKPARPVDYLAMFMIDDPTAVVGGLPLRKVEQLSAYLRSLKIQPAPAGKFWMACLKQSSFSTSGWSAEHNCIARAFKMGEAVWANPETGVKVLAEDCTNPVGLPAQFAECGHIFVYQTTRETALRLKEYVKGDPLSDTQCSGVKRPGESDYESPYVDECPEVLCNFVQVDQVLQPFGYIGKRKGSLTAAAGVYDFLVPRAAASPNSPYVFAFCTERWFGPSPLPPVAISANASPEIRAQFNLDREAYLEKKREWSLTHSCGTTVKWVDYVQIMGVPTATIYYDEAAAKKSGTRKSTGEPTDLYWYWVDENGQCVVSAMR